MPLHHCVTFNGPLTEERAGASVPVLLLELWSMLSDHIDKTSGIRNKIAHSTLVQVDGHPRVVPHFSLSKEKAGFSESDLEDFTARFHRLTQAVVWMQSAAFPNLTPHTKPLEQEPELIFDFRHKISLKK